MKFEYLPAVIASPDGGDFFVIDRPNVPFSVVGDRFTTSHIGLVDTGSDITILPKSVADRLGILVRLATGPSAEAFGGATIELYIGEVRLQLESGDEVIRWTASVYFREFPAGDVEWSILGHAGFLDYFTATFYGLDAILTLEPNIALPIAS